MSVVVSEFEIKVVESSLDEEKSMHLHLNSQAILIIGRVS